MEKMHTLVGSLGKYENYYSTHQGTGVVAVLYYRATITSGPVTLLSSLLMFLRSQKALFWLLREDTYTRFNELTLLAIKGCNLQGIHTRNQYRHRVCIAFGAKIWNVHKV